MGFYGKTDEPGIEIRFGDLSNNRLAELNSDESGKGSVTFDLKKIGEKFSGNSFLNGLAMKGLHEGDHGYRINEFGFPASRAERLQRERDGYWMEAAYQNAHNFMFGQGDLWSKYAPGDGYNEGALEWKATMSVDESCGSYSGGNC